MSTAPGDSTATRRCARCILPESFPGVALDDEGVCNHCTSGAEWPPQFPEAQREKEDAKLRELFARRNRKGSHDVMVGLSGGKDSAMLAYTLQKEYDARVLGYTFVSPFTSDVAKRNLPRIADALKIDHVVVSGASELLLEILRYFVEKDEGSLHRQFCPICGAVYGLMSMRVARAHRIPYIAYGRSFEQDTPRLHTDKAHFHQSIWMPDELFWEVLGPADREYLWDLYSDSLTHLLPRRARCFVARRASRRTFRRFATSRPAVIMPFKAIPYEPGVFERRVVELGLIEEGEQGPADTNCKLVPLFLTHDTHELGYNPFVQEYAAYVRSGVLNREEYAELFDRADEEILEGTYRQDVLEETCVRMGLSYEATFSRWRRKTEVRRGTQE